MVKLLILDKDGTLVRPKSGGTFPTHPEDQELLPGVAKAIARYAAAGWSMAIASNQGGCMVQTGSPYDFPIGAYYVNGTDKPIKVVGKTIHPDGADKVKAVTLRLAEERSNGKDWLWFEPEALVKFQYKTLDDAIAEMKFCLKLTGVEKATFCPDAGETLIRVDRWNKVGYFPMHTPIKFPCLNSYNSFSIGSKPTQWRSKFRKPDPGMIKYLAWGAVAETILMVGDRPEDQQAAANAGIPFMWAADWVNSTPAATVPAIASDNPAPDLRSSHGDAG